MLLLLSAVVRNMEKTNILNVLLSIVNLDIQKTLKLCVYYFLCTSLAGVFAVNGSENVLNGYS